MKQPLHINGVKDYARLKFKFSEAAETFEKEGSQF